MSKNVNVKVVVRFRPLNSAEIARKHIIKKEIVKKKMIKITPEVTVKRIPDRTPLSSTSIMFSTDPRSNRKSMRWWPSQFSRIFSKAGTALFSPTGRPHREKLLPCKGP